MAEKTTTCLLCGGTATLRHAAYPGYMEPEKFSIYHCGSCKTGFALPRNDASAIYNLIYNNAAKVPGYSRYMSYAGIVRKTKNPLSFLASTSEAYYGVKKVLKEDPAPEKNIRILEVGSGLGYLTYSLVRAGYDASGMDISESAVKQATKRFGNYYFSGDVNSFAALNAGKYDYVISTEVIEHIDDPRKFLNSILTLLKPGGKAVITTPSKSSYPDSIIWVSDLPPVHLWWFAEESIRYMAREINATVQFIDFSGFYRNNYKAEGLMSKLRLPSPFFNEKGELIVKTSTGKSSLKYRIIAAAQVFSFFRNIAKRTVGSIRKLFDKNIIVFSEKGALICAVIKTKDNSL